jgi:hypothetical protein
MRAHAIQVIAVCGLIMAVATPTDAQQRRPRCPEGRTAAGQCVDAALAQSNRATSIVFAQPKFSYTAPPYLPIEDRGYYIARDKHELNNLFRATRNTSVLP